MMAAVPLKISKPSFVALWPMMWCWIMAWESCGCGLMRRADWAGSECSSPHLSTVSPGFFFTSTWTLLSHLPPSHHLNYILLASYDNKSFVRWMGANFCASEVRPFDYNGDVLITFQSPHLANHRLLVYSRMHLEVWYSDMVSFIIKGSEVLRLKNTVCFSYNLTASFSSHTEKLFIYGCSLCSSSRGHLWKFHFGKRSSLGQALNSHMRHVYLLQH